MDTSAKKKPQDSAASSYRKMEVVTANRESILLMMYSGAIRFLKKAIEHTENYDPSEQGKMLGKCLAIISELRATLNFEIGKEIATQLDGLYGYISRRLLQAQMDKDVTILREVLQILETLHSGWEQAVEVWRKENKK